MSSALRNIQNLFAEALDFDIHNPQTHFSGFTTRDTTPSNNTIIHMPDTRSSVASASTNPSHPSHPSTSTMAALPLEVGLIRSPFDGVSTDVNDFLRECEENVKGRNILPDSDLFSEACLTVAKCRLNYESRAVTSALHAFNAQSRAFHTWTEFRDTFIASFGKPAVPDPIRLFEAFERRPPSFSEGDLRTFVNDLRGDICLWGQECTEGSLSTALTGQATSKGCQLYLIRSILVGSLPANKREKIYNKVRASSIHTIAHDFAIAIKAEPEVVTVAANAAWQGKNSSQGARTGSAQGGAGAGNDGRGWQQNGGRPGNPASNRNNGAYTGRTRQGQSDHIWVPERGQCYNCLRMGHRVRECKLQPMCPYHGSKMWFGHSWLKCEFRDKAKQTFEKLRQIRGKGNNSRAVAVFQAQPLLGDPSAAISNNITLMEVEDEMES